MYFNFFDTVHTAQQAPLSPGWVRSRVPEDFALTFSLTKRPYLSL